MERLLGDEVETRLTVIEAARTDQENRTWRSFPTGITPAVLRPRLAYLQPPIFPSHRTFFGARIEHESLE